MCTEKLYESSKRRSSTGNYLVRYGVRSSKEDNELDTPSPSEARVYIVSPSNARKAALSRHKSEVGGPGSSNKHATTKHGPNYASYSTIIEAYLWPSLAVRGRKSVVNLVVRVSLTGNCSVDRCGTDISR